jgi:mycothiol synthase
MRRRGWPDGYGAPMPTVDRLAALGAERAGVERLLAAAAAEDDHAPIEHPGEAHDAVLLLAADGAGYGEVTPIPGGWQVAYAVDPEARTPGSTVAADLLVAARRVVAERGGGRLQLWVDRPTAPVERLLAGAGFSAERALYQMRRPLPLDGSAPELETRAFVRGQDEEAWVAVNNRAFSWHPEQGGWTVADVEAHEAEAWFDPDGFLLREEEGQLVGFCWTKVHAAHEPPLGEIYVIAVDPGAGRRGLGRQLVVAGLAYLADRGLRVGMLYCDATNRPALKLYVDLGFEVDHVDRVYAGIVPG